MAGMATHRQGAMVAAAPAAHASQAITKSDLKADITVSVRVPDTIHLLAGGCVPCVCMDVMGPIDRWWSVAGASSCQESHCLAIRLAQC